MREIHYKQERADSKEAPNDALPKLPPQSAPRRHRIVRQGPLLDSRHYGRGKQESERNAALAESGGGRSKAAAVR